MKKSNIELYLKDYFKKNIILMYHLNKSVVSLTVVAMETKTGKS